MPGPMPPPPSSSGAPIWIILIAVGAVLLLGCGGILLALLLPAVQAAREAARRNASQNNLKQIIMAVHQYESTHNTFPPAVVRDQAGRPLYSGFVLLLPYLEQQALHQRFKLDEPWDSPANRMVSQTALSIFQDPSSSSTMSNRTDYQFVMGPGTVFENGDGRRATEIVDGLSNTIFFIEVGGSMQPWAAPGGWDVSRASAPVVGNHPRGTIVATGDGAVRFIDLEVPIEVWRELSTRAGGEVLRPVF
jgi:type II secretory pathway pseudopilin PulG